VLRLDSEDLRSGITAVSAGNHAIAASFAAQAVGSSAKVVMMRSASPVRVDACRQLGAEVVFADDVHHAFDRVREISETEGRVIIHPFEGHNVTAGTATLGMEICEQVPGFDVIIVPIGGGGLCSGIASAAKQINPDCTVIGVEPEGADSMSRSFVSGRAEKLAHVSTIADSLGAPFAMPYSYSVCAQYVDDIIRVSDDQLREAMGILYREMKMAVEPACAASTAALAALRDRLAGNKVVLVFCGSNIDWKTFRRNAWLDA
jgi:threonine dehydratase